MKKKTPYLNITLDALLICCGALAALFMVASSYDISFEMATIIYVTLIFSFAFSFLFHGKKNSFFVILLFLITVAVFAILDRRPVINGFKIMYYAILKPPSAIFPFLPVPKEPNIPLIEVKGAVTTFMIIVSELLSLIIALAVKKSSSPLPAILVLLPAVFLSMVYTDCSPALYSLILLVLYFGGVLLGNSIRGGTKKHAQARIVFLALLACMAFGLKFISPESEFSPIPYDQRRNMLGDGFGRMQDGVLSVFSRNPKQYGLDSIGDKVMSDSTAFTVSSSSSGSYLLRTHSYGLYSNNTFLPSPEYTGTWQSLYALGASQIGDTETISIRGAMTNERLVPYAFLDDGYTRVEEGFVRSYGETGYMWTFKPTLRFTPVKSGKEESDYYLFALNNYTMAGGAQKEKLIKLMNSTFPSPVSLIKDFYSYIRALMRTDYYTAAVTVADYVRGVGEYTLQPGSTPRGADFVEHFLSESKKGYCVHYASATAALLQALDIPARFTIGYRADIVEADEWQTIPKQASHAWVEVYIKGVGWVPIECTPGFPGNSEYAPAGGSYPEPTPTPEPTPEPTRDPNAPVSEPPETELPDIVKPSNNPRESATPRPTNTPNPGGSGSSGGKRGFNPLWLLIIPGVFALWMLIGLIVDRIRQRMFRQSDPNAAVLCMLRYLRRLERFGLPPEPDAKEIGEEAVFSNHSMSAKQHQLIERCRGVRSSAFKKKRIKRFFLRRLIFLL